MLAQVEEAVARRAPQRLAPVTRAVTPHPGNFIARMRPRLYALLGLDEPEEPRPGGELSLLAPLEQFGGGWW